MGRIQDVINITFFMEGSHIILVLSGILLCAVMFIPISVLIVCASKFVWNSGSKENLPFEINVSASQKHFGELTLNKLF